MRLFFRTVPEHNAFILIHGTITFGIQDTVLGAPFQSRTGGKKTQKKVR